MSFHFEKSSRLLNASEYQAVFDESRLKVSTAELLFLARKNDLNRARLGLVIAKKNVKLSVQRNRIKRVIRETFRMNKHNLQGIDIIVLARRGLGDLSNKKLNETCNQLWHQLEKRAEKRFRQQEG
ncbi:Ribonuclease P protein component [Zhongshania aliphaticivorans]|uniref:Ribonuclease P protein component n=1 Tax=Zhongshania aliphaticivorans TaxID=1470434 RepID=A0A5S9PJI0_9GAMM|nr:ribonuclease P protein component [Zhongshania aliphaticivorans]CAA0104411.1 Ribonuclease P protein component [Zhongshania aliphaticivorans]CAA0104653.1 Ribonuclease P protein component [Zhongshania aliphaticivorans]